MSMKASRSTTSMRTWLTARAILPSDSLSLRMIESQDDVLPYVKARVVVPMLARMLWEEFRERPTAS